jgi:hypothetical protein
MFNIYGYMPGLPGAPLHEETEPEAGTYTAEQKIGGVWEARSSHPSMGAACLALKAALPGSYGYACQTHPVADLITVRVRDDKGRVVWPQDLKEK